MIDSVPTRRVLATPQLVLPVLVRRFHDDRSGYCIMYPAERVNPQAWAKWVETCKLHASFDPDNKFWVWSWRRVESMTVAPEAAEGLSLVNTNALEDIRKKAREQWQEQQRLMEAEAAEISKLENVPESDWPNFHYPDHYKPKDPAPTALQRIAVSRYWNREGSLLCASVGTGKSRMVIDMLGARATHPPTRDSARIILIVAPLSLHENWRREWSKWTSIDFRPHRYQPTRKDFWNALELDATDLFELNGDAPGGLVIICTAQALARPQFLKYFEDRKITPTAVVVDEAHKAFRNARNKAHQTLMKLRKDAHVAVALSGTPTSKFQDWFALEEFIGGGKPEYHWQDGVLSDYEMAGDPTTYRFSGFYQQGMTFDSLIKSYHAERIKKGHIFIACKSHYMKDSLPGLDQQELGFFANMRLSFTELVEQYPQYIDAAVKFHNSLGGEKSLAEMTDQMQAVTLMLRMAQLAALSEDNTQLLQNYVEEILAPEEPAVLWTQFRNPPCEELQLVEGVLRKYGTVEHIAGDITGPNASELRQAIVDRFQSGETRFLVGQPDSGGVGLNLTRPKSTLFLSIPLSYLNVSQALGRLHRLGQVNDVTAYFAMTSPIAAFARHIFDRRAHLNETIPTNYKLNLK